MHFEYLIKNQEGGVFHPKERTLDPPTETKEI